MCGRYSLYDVAPEIIEAHYNARFEERMAFPEYNVAPAAIMPVVTNEDASLIQMLDWGIKPVWYKKKTGLINIRAETLKEKKTFQKLLEFRRCLVPATGFYEWKKVGDKKLPYHIKLKDKILFSFAGLWSEDKGENGRVTKNFTIITTEPNEMTVEVHNRMPVILHSSDEEKWIGEDANGLIDLLAPYPAEEMEMYEISPKINNPANNSPELIKRI
jgi:putative SOS response-associated peptidase YedK